MAKKNTKATKVATAAINTNDEVLAPVAAATVEPTKAAEAPQAVNDDVPPGATPKAETPKLTEEQKKAKRSERRKARRLAKLAAEGKVPMAERPKAPNGIVIPREGGARRFCYEVQAANGFPDCKVLTGLLVAAAKGTPFEGRPQRWFARRAWRNARLYKSVQTEAQLASAPADEG